MSENEKKKISKAQQNAVNKYVKNHYDRFLVTLPKGQKDHIQQIASDLGESMNEFIRKSIDMRISELNEQQA